MESTDVRLHFTSKSVILHLACLSSICVFLLNDLSPITGLFDFLPEEGTLCVNDAEATDIYGFYSAARDGATLTMRQHLRFELGPLGFNSWCHWF
jgi:hypothetical protein